MSIDNTTTSTTYMETNDPFLVAATHADAESTSGEDVGNEEQGLDSMTDQNTFGASEDTFSTSNACDGTNIHHGDDEEEDLTLTGVGSGSGDDDGSDSSSDKDDSDDDDTAAPGSGDGPRDDDSRPTTPPPDPAKLSKYEKCYRFEAVRSRMSSRLLSRDTIIEHLEYVRWGVDAAVKSLRRAHRRAYTYTRRGAEPELPTSVRGIEIVYYRTGNSEKRQAVDIFFQLVQQMNQCRDPTAQISVARSEAIFIMDASGFDFEAALHLVQDAARYTQMFHIRYDGLRTRSSDTKKEQEQSDVALAYYITLTDRPDWYSMQQDLNGTHQKNLVAAVREWQAQDVAVMVHPNDVVDTDGEGIGRRQIWKNARLVRLALPTFEDTHEYAAKHLPWRSEPAAFANTINALGTALKAQPMRQAQSDRHHGRVYGSVINHDNDYPRIHCPDEGKFLVEYISRGKYRGQGFGEKKRKQPALFHWPARDRENPRGLPIFSWAKQKHLTKMNNLRRQAYFRITGIVGRTSGALYTAEDFIQLWGLYQSYFEELMANRPAGTDRISLPFQIPSAKKEEFAQVMTHDPAHPRSVNAIVTQAHRHREICKDLLVLYDPSNDHRAQATEYNKRRKAQIETIRAVLKKVKVELPIRFVKEALEKVAVPHKPWTWDEYMPVYATAPLILPSAGLPLSIRPKVEREVAIATELSLAAGTYDDASVWQQAAEAIRHFYRSEMKGPELVEIQVLLDLVDMTALDLTAIGEEEAIAIFAALELWARS